MDPTPETSQRTRQRITLACNGCRQKRTKCDGLRPQCSACAYREEHCEFTQVESKRKRASNQYIASLEARVASLEHILAAKSHDTRKLLKDPAIEPNVSSYHASVEQAASFGSIVSVDGANPNVSDGSTIDPVSDLTDVLEGFTIGDAGELRFFGASSSLNLSQHYSIPTHDTTPSSARARGLEAAQLHGVAEVPDELRDHLLSLYWRWQNSWQYLVPQESFLRDLHITKTEQFLTPLLLTAILALASRYSDRQSIRSDPDDPNTAGLRFYTQAQAMLHCEYEAPTTSTIQATALIGLYITATDKESLGWLYVGQASRMAFNLGLHSDCSQYVHQGVLSPEEADARNIAWWGVYVIDRLYGLGMGRPVGIQDYNITAGKPEYSKSGRGRVTDLLAGLNTAQRPFYMCSEISINAIYTCELFKLSSEVLERLYSRRPGWTIVERDDRITKTQMRLTDFHDRWPPTLKISPSALKLALPHVYHLHLQYHVVLILLHRPFVQRFRQASNSSKAECNIDTAQVQEELHAQVCRVAARKIAHIFRSYRSNYTLRYIQISAVHAAVTAVVIHLFNIGDPACSYKDESLQCARLLIRSLYEMNIAWFWCNRSIRVIESLAVELNVDLWRTGLANEIPSENLLSYERYKGEVTSPAPGFPPQGPLGLIPFHVSHESYVDSAWPSTLDLDPQHDANMDTQYFGDVFGDNDWLSRYAE